MSKYKKIIKSMELIRCLECGGEGQTNLGNDCVACHRTGIKRDPRDLGNKKISAWIDTVIAVCKNYSELIS